VLYHSRQLDRIMGYSSFNNPFGFVLTKWVKRLILANAAVFVVTLAFSGLVPYLALIPARLLTQPWSLLTYMFVHAGFFHLLFNMLALFFFGPPLEQRWGASQFLKFYLLAGLGGALLSLVFPNQMIVGASGAVYGVMVAFAVYWPENPIYIYGIFPIKAKWLVLFLVGLSLFYSLTGGASGVAHLAHLGGAAAGFFYLKSPWAPSPWGEAPRKRKPRQWRVFSSGAAKSPRKEAPTAPASTPAPRVREEQRALDEVDRILDKISQSGLASLTADERRRLDEASRRFRSN
jgi:membrane associated rhomboid family serine protease